MIEIQYINIDNFDEYNFELNLSNLPEFCIKDILTNKNMEDQKLKLAARVIINNFIKRNNSGLSLENWSLGKRLKPYISGFLEFNISHSSKIAVVAFNKVPIGIDIEKAKPIEFKEIIEQFHWNEKAYIENSKYPELEFYRIWTKKEAYFKLSGAGIVDGLSGINLVNNIINETTHFVEINIHKDYVCHICTTNPDIIKISQFVF